MASLENKKFQRRDQVTCYRSLHVAQNIVKNNEKLFWGTFSIGIPLVDIKVEILVCLREAKLPN